MYRIFRDNKQSLPGDEEIMKTQKPSIKIVLQPLSIENNELSLPKLEYSQLILQPNMVIESLKKYIKKKLEDKIDPNYQVSLSYKNIEMLDHYTIKDIERIYSFTGEKTIFYYSKKSRSSNIINIRNENTENNNLSKIDSNIDNNIKNNVKGTLDEFTQDQNNKSNNQNIPNENGLSNETKNTNSINIENIEMKIDVDS